MAALQAGARATGLKPGDLLMAWGYDENLMPKGNPLSREALDTAFPDNPVGVVRVSMDGNGDAAIDLLSKAHLAAAGNEPAKDRRTVCIHCQFIRADQIEALAKYKIIPSLFTDLTFFFGDTHVANRGAEQAAFISPMRSALAAGLRPIRRFRLSPAAPLTNTARKHRRAASKRASAPTSSSCPPIRPRWRQRRSGQSRSSRRSRTAERSGRQIECKRSMSMLRCGHRQRRRGLLPQRPRRRGDA